MRSVSVPRALRPPPWGAWAGSRRPVAGGACPSRDACGNGPGGKVGMRGRDLRAGRREVAANSMGDAGDQCVRYRMALVGVRQGVRLLKTGLSAMSSWAAGRGRRGWTWTEVVSASESHPGMGGCC